MNKSLVFLGMLMLPGAVASAQGGLPIDDAQIQAAIGKGVDYLWKQQNDDGSWTSNIFRGNVKHSGGVTAMASYALMETGISPNSPRLRKALSWMERSLGEQNYLPESDSTYTIGFRCQAWLMANACTNDGYLRVMKRDVERIVASTPSGDYDYLCSGRAEYAGLNRPDNSNSQYALYGIWAGKLNSVHVPQQYWEQVFRYWMASQNEDGGWGYMKKDERSLITMAAAGLASLYVCSETLELSHFLAVGQQPTATGKAIQKGLAYIDGHFVKSLEDPAAYKVSGWLMYYHLFGIQRVGLAGHMKRFGGADWYRLGARVLLDLQNADGSWPGGAENITSEALTSYALMFLARGQRPLPIVQLNYGQGWNNRPHAMSNMLYWMGRTLERPFRGQVVAFADPELDWHDAKVLLIAGHRCPEFPDAQIEKLRAFVQDGGTILSIAEGNRKEFQDGMRAAYERILPWYVLKPLRRDHPVYNFPTKLDGTVRLCGISDGARLVAIHTDYDLVGEWQANEGAQRPAAFEAGTNILLYANPALGGLRPTTRQSMARRMPIQPALDPEQVKQNEGAVAALVKVVNEYRRQLLLLERQRTDAIRAVGADIAGLFPAAIKAAAAAGHLDEATVLLAAQKVLTDTGDLDFKGAPSPELAKVRAEYDKKVKTVEDGCEAKLKQVEDRYEPQVQAAREAVIRALPISVQPVGGK